MRDAARAAWCCLVLLRRSQLAGADGVAGGCGSKNIGRRRGGDGKVSLESVRNAALPGFGVLRRGGTGLPDKNWKGPVLTKWVPTTARDAGGSILSLTRSL